MDQYIDQFSDLSCPICFSCFSERENVPHMLKCGHTICRQCFINLINYGDSKCGECRTLILHQNFHLLPINYSVLRLIEAMKTKETKFNEFKEVDAKIDKMVKSLNKTRELYRSRVNSNLEKIDELDVEIKKIKETKQALKKKYAELGMSKSLDESLNIIKVTLDKIKEVQQKNALIDDRLQKGYNIDGMQSVYDAPEDFYIKYDGDLGSTCFSLNRKIYMRSLHQSAAYQQHRCAVNIQALFPYLAGTFMLIEYEGRTVLLEFEVFKEDNRGKQFMEMCLAENGSCYMNSKFYDHKRVGKEGESVIIGPVNPHDSKASKKDLNRGACKVDYIRKGFLESLGNDASKGTHFRIYLEDWPCKKSQFCFGKLVRGGSILKSIIRNRYEVNVNECGLIFNPLLNI